MLALCLMLLVTYYAFNYIGIIDWGLTAGDQEVDQLHYDIGKVLEDNVEFMPLTIGIKYIKFNQTQICTTVYPCS